MEDHPGVASLRPPGREGRPGAVRTGILPREVGTILTDRLRRTVILTGLRLQVSPGSSTSDIDFILIFLAFADS